MSYEYMTGMGLETLRSKGLVNGTSAGAGAGAGGGQQLVTVAMSPAAIALAKPPAGSVRTMPEERQRLRAWACTAYGASSSWCLKPDDPGFTYMDAAKLALFRNAQLSQAQLGRESIDPVRAARPGMERQEAQSLLPRFRAWWKECSRATWAYWMITPGFGPSYVPKEAWESFKRTAKGLRAAPPCTKAFIDRLFKVKYQWKPSEMLASAPAQAGRFDTTGKPVVGSPCPPGAIISVLAPMKDEGFMVKQGCGIIKRQVQGAPGEFLYCCPKGFKRQTYRPGSTTIPEYTCPFGSEKTLLKAYSPEEPLIQRGCAAIYKTGEGETLERYYCCPPVQDEQKASEDQGISVDETAPANGNGGAPANGNGGAPANGNGGAPANGNGVVLTNGEPESIDEAHLLEEDQPQDTFSQYKWPLLIGSLALAGAGAYWYFKMRRRSPQLPPPVSPASPSGLAANPGGCEPCGYGAWGRGPYGRRRYRGIW